MKDEDGFVPGRESCGVEKYRQISWHDKPGPGERACRTVNKTDGQAKGEAKEKVLVIDNYDSFTYNLVQYLALLGAQVVVYRNDQITPAEVELLQPTRIVISPGPGRPETAGYTCAIIENWAGKIPILGVCLGHQAIAEVFGGRIVRAAVPVHGKVSAIYHDGKTIFSRLASPFKAVRYHSLIVERKSLPACLEVSAWTAEGLIMGLRHRSLAVEGVQFHPESVLTSGGLVLLANFLFRGCTGREIPQPVRLKMGG